MQNFITFSVKVFIIALVVIPFVVTILTLNV